MASALEKLLLGRTLVGRYLVERVIGRGGMSVVYEATDQRLDRPVALKVVSFPAELDGSDRPLLRERLRREAASAAKLAAHPNVVQVYDYGTDPELDLDFIVMELLPGVDLREALREGEIALDEGLAILRQAARGLAAGHRAGIIHRDVKPANIFLTRRDEDRQPIVKILDFGIAKALDPAADDLTHHEKIPHSPAYASPEQLEPGGRLTPASDVYQLGLVAYELLTGERPYSQEDQERIRRGENVPIPTGERWSRLPSGIRASIQQALALLPTDRYPDARAFVGAIEGLSGDDDGEDQTWSAVADDSASTLGLGVPDGAQRTLMTAPAERADFPVDPRDRSGIASVARSHTEAAPPRRRIGAGSGLLLAAAVALLVLILSRVGGSSGSGGDPSTEEPVADRAALQEAFRPLLFEAAEAVREASSAEQGEGAAAAVQEVIYALHRSWVEGDLETHVAQYADRVDFQGATGVSRDRIRDLREESLDRYDAREVVIPQLAIEFPAPGQARALVDLSWSLQGDGRS